MEITLNRYQADHFPEGAVVEINTLLASPERGVFADKFTFEGNWGYSIRLSPAQLREIFPYQVGVFAVAARPGQGRTTFLREWLDSNPQKGRPVVYVNVDGDTSKGEIRASNVVEVLSEKASDIRPILESLPRGGVLVIDTANNLLGDKPPDEKRPFEEARTLADEAFKRGLMVVLSVQRTRFKVGAGIEIIPLRPAPRLEAVDPHTEFVRDALYHIVEQEKGRSFQVGTRDLLMVSDCPLSEEEVRGVGQARPFLKLTDDYLALYAAGQDLWSVSPNNTIIPTGQNKKG